jgi:hypothetical protein
VKGERKETKRRDGGVMDNENDDFMFGGDSFIMPESDPMIVHTAKMFAVRRKLDKQ